MNTLIESQTQLFNTFSNNKIGNGANKSKSIENSHQLFNRFTKTKTDKKYVKQKINNNDIQDNLSKNTINTFSELSSKISNTSSSNIGHGSEVDKFDRVTFESVKEAIWRFSAPYFLTDVVKDYINIYGLSEVKFCGIQFYGTCSIPIGAEFRYASSPSYLGSRNSMILKIKESDRVRER